MKKTVVNWVALGVGGSFGKHVTDIFTNTEKSVFSV